jgi:selenocysteine lyase/cysteine desulfurase
VPIDRRGFLAGAAAFAASPRGVDPASRTASGIAASVRADFPWVTAETYLNSAAIHPLSAPAARAMERYLAYRLRGPGEGREDFDAEKQKELKQRYARLIGAKASEIAFVQSTSDGENIVVSGMDLPRRGGNVVLDELHFTTSLYMYKALEARGLELRVVKHRDWRIALEDVARAVDKDTRLVSMALVSNVNGYMHDVKAVSELAHARGAYLYADVIQAVGAVPVDVAAMGIDFCAASTYKWLMGERGFGYLYVREDLQDTVVPRTRYGHRQVTNFDRVGLTWDALPGAARYETGTIPVVAAVCAHESMRYLERLGMDRIRAHARDLTDRLQKELPARGYPSLTPAGTPTPIAAFQVQDARATAARLERARVAVTIVEKEQRMRVSVSVFNNHEDIDRLLSVLAAT